jgi:hypothetical protein
LEDWVGEPFFVPWDDLDLLGEAIGKLRPGDASVRAAARSYARERTFAAMARTVVEALFGSGAV